MATAAPTKPSPVAKRGERVIDASFLAGAKEIAQFPPPVLLEVAFAGRSNVGKSSLMNSLMQRRGLVRTSGTPGCTRQISWFHAKSDDGAEICLTDLPGYGYAKRSKDERKAWARVIEGYLLGRPTLRAVVLLADARRGFEDDDRDLVELLQSQPTTSRPAVQVLLVATKLDKLSGSARKPALAELDRSPLVRELGTKVIGYSAVEDIGRRQLWFKLREAAGLTDGSLPTAEAPAGS
jgi:GTP-binding protein